MVVVALALASVSWIEYSARSSCDDVGRSLSPRRVAPDAGKPVLVDEILPEYQLGEKHSVYVEAPPERVFESLKRVTGDEQPRSRLLDLLPVVFGERGVASGDEPLYEVLRDDAGLMLEEPGRQVATANIATAGESTPSTPNTVRRFLAYRPRHDEMKVAVDLRVDAAGDGSRLTTETRMMFDDQNLCRDFGRYYGAIYPGSSLIRVDLLEAVERRAERGARPADRSGPAAADTAALPDDQDRKPGDGVRRGWH